MRCLEKLSVWFCWLALLVPFQSGAAQTDKQFPEAPEPIKFMPYGGYKHDDAGERKKRPETQAAETPATPSWLPRPILFSGPSLPGGGYQMFAGNVGGGLLLNSSKLLGDFEAHYMNARKNDDGTINNRKGHERYLRGRLFYPLHKGLYFGGGAQWSETATTNYTKKAWRPTFGLGGDHFAEDWSCRWQVLYITKGTDKSNAVQGPEFQFWLPSPASKSHFFYRQSLGLYEFHTTVTDPTNPKLTASQRGERGVTGFADFSFGWRF